MSHEVYGKIAFRGETPWHHLGISIAKGATIQQILTLAGMDHKIERRIVRMRTNRNDTTQGTEIPGYMAIVRANDNHVFQIASDRYMPMQYSDMVMLFQDFVQAGDMELETCGLLKDGAVAWALARYTDESITLNGDGVDKVLPRVLIYTSHDGSLVTEAGFRIKHSRKDKKSAIAEARLALGLFKQQVEEFRDTTELLTHTKIQGQEQVLEYVARLTNPKLLDTIIEAQQATNDNDGDILGAIIGATITKASSKTLSKEDLNRAGRAILHEISYSPGSDLSTAKDTWWGVLNGVTSYVDHGAGTRVAADDNRENAREDNRLTSAWFGNGDIMKSTALELAVQYAEGTYKN
jgi:hypothetical protein